VYANAKNIDGYYFFVRTDPLLSKSGIGQLDAAKYFGENGLVILGEVLSNASSYCLRWVICADPAYDKILAQNGFVQRFTQDTTGDSRFGGTSIWEYNGSIPEYVPNNFQDGKSRLNDYIWGIAPPLVLLVTVSLLIIEKLKKKDESPA
jgi:hypothetical protein